MLYTSNQDDSLFRIDTDANRGKFREFNKTIDDRCAIQQRNDDNSKKLKFITTNHIDLLEAKSALNFYGMTIRDTLFVPSEGIDTDSGLRMGTSGGVLTNCNVRHGFGQLPLPTMPSRYQLFHGDVVVEDSIRNFLETNRQSCNPRDNEYYNRSFYIFNQERGIETPDATKSVETPQFGPRGGSSTRFA